MTSTDRATSTGPPSPANVACAGRPIVPGEGVRRRCRGAAHALRRRVRARSRPDRATPSTPRPEEALPGETAMISLLDTIGPAIWRASWQGAVLALLVVLLLRCLGERLSPRWRFLLWGVVLTRLLLVATPVSPWSVFNLARWDPQASTRRVPRHDDASLTAVPHRADSIAGHRRTERRIATRPPTSAAEYPSGPCGHSFRDAVLSLRRPRGPSCLPSMADPAPYPSRESWCRSGWQAASCWG